MKFPIIKNINRTERILILIGLMIVGTILASFSPLLFTRSIESFSKLNVLRITQIISQFFMFIAPPLLYAVLVKEKPMHYLGFKKTSPWHLLIGVMMMYTILPLNNVFAEWNANISLPESMRAIEDIMKSLQEQATEITERMLNVNTVGGLLVNLFMIAGLAAFGEELIFRSMLQPFLIKACRNVHIGIFVASCVFSFIHFEFYGFLPRLVLGMLLGYMFYYSKSIWVPMLMHFVNNGTAVVLYYLNNIGVTNIDVESFGQTEIFPLIISIIGMTVMFWFAIKLHNKTSE